MHRLMTFTAGLFILALLVPEPALAQAPVACEFEYTVQAGDWLSKIAEKYYGDPLAYERIVTAANANPQDNYANIDDPNLIEPGWLLCLPAASRMPNANALA